MEFAASFVVMQGMLALVETRLSDPWRNGLLLRGTVAVQAVAMIAEMAYVIAMGWHVGVAAAGGAMLPLIRL